MAASADLYSIRDLSRDFDVTTRTLRFYEEKGLLEPERLGQKRLYTAADRVRLKLILRGKRLGFSLEESAELIAMYDPESNNAPQLQALIDKIQAQRRRVEEFAAVARERRVVGGGGGADEVGEVVLH